MNIRDLRIGQRLTLGFGLVIALLMLLAGLAVLRIQNLSSEVGVLVDEVYPRTQLAQDMKMDLQDVSRSMLSVLVMQDPDQIKAELAAIAKATARNEEHLGKLRAAVQDEEGRKLIQAIVEIRERSLKQQKTFVGMIEGEDKETALTKFLFSIRPAQAKFFGLLDDLVAQQQKAMDTAGAQSADVARKTQALIGVLALAAMLSPDWRWFAAVLAAVVTGFFLRWLTTHPGTVARWHALHPHPRWRRLFALAEDGRTQYQRAWHAPLVPLYALLAWAAYGIQGLVFGHYAQALWPGVGLLDAAYIFVLASLVGGRTAFLVGSALLLATMLATTGRRSWPVWVLSAACAAGSPVAGLFLMLFGASAWCAGSLPRVRAAALVVAPVVLLVPLLVLFPEGGDFPFPWAGAVNTLVIACLAVWAGWRFVVLRWVGAAYAVLCLAAALMPSPVGGNAARLATTAAPVVLVLVVRIPDRVGRAALAGVVAAVLVAQWSPVSLALSGDRAPTEAAYYRPLLDLLDGRRAVHGVERIEVVPVATHTESDIVARRFLLARGWNRQLDRRFHHLFYGSSLTAAQYRDWLVENGVTLCIQPNLFDQGARGACRLHGQSIPVERVGRVVAQHSLPHLQS